MSMIPAAQTEWRRERGSRCTREYRPRLSNATARDGTAIVFKGKGVAPPDNALIVDGEIKAQVPALTQISLEV